MKHYIAMSLFKLALHTPEWVYGRKAVLDLTLMYMMITPLSKVNR